MSARRISIHALLAESDLLNRRFRAIHNAFLSTLSLRRATPGERHASSQQEFLSTLSLRRATVKGKPACAGYLHFYPRSPCGERQLQGFLLARGHNFYPRSPCGERQSQTVTEWASSAFLSTLSLRRATGAPLFYNNQCQDFYPRSPCGERRFYPLKTFVILPFLSTLSLRRATLLVI